MAWTCYSCRHKNPNSADVCVKCGGTVAAPRSFYVHWVLGGAFCFLLTYVFGTFLGGTLLDFIVWPSDAQVLDVAKSLNLKGANEVKNIRDLNPVDLAAARTATLAKVKSEMSPFAREGLYWGLPALLFILCGLIVGFVSDGKTILEAGFGSILGQVGGFLIMMFVVKQTISFVALGVGLVIGFGLAVLGAWRGEAVQERKERSEQ